jgi:hypothetical protein
MYLYLDFWVGFSGLVGAPYSVPHLDPRLATQDPDRHKDLPQSYRFRHQHWWASGKGNILFRLADVGLIEADGEGTATTYGIDLR